MKRKEEERKEEAEATREAEERKREEKRKKEAEVKRKEAAEAKIMYQSLRPYSCLRRAPDRGKRRPPAGGRGRGGGESKREEV